MRVKSNFIFFVLFILITPFFSVLSAQGAAKPWWLSLEHGKLSFRSGNYGAALLQFEDARRDRRIVYEQMERDFIHFLSQREVRRIGDYLDKLERFSYDNYQIAASKALEELFYRIPRASFNNSATAALQAFDRLKNYPEAEYWIGELYRVEGELSLALAQYHKAYSMRDVLEDSGFSTVLQYKISSVLMTRQEYNEMEKVLHSIINELDTLWINAGRAEVTRREIAAVNTDTMAVPYDQASASFMRLSMVRILENDGITRFLELYRYNNTTVEQAHRLLGFYYAVSGRPSAQQHLMFSFLIQNTIIIDEIKRRQFDFAFTTLPALAEEINKSAIILSYIEEVEYYKTTYYLAASLFRNGRVTVARSLWDFLASQPQAGEWRNRAINQLRNPHQEPIVEMP